MSLLKIYKNCHFIFQPNGRKIEIKVKVKEGKLFINDKPFLHQFTFKNNRNIFEVDEGGYEYFLYQTTIRNFLNNLLKDKVIAIKNSRLVLSE